MKLEIEDLWGYAKRLRFVRDSICAAFLQGSELQVLDVGCGNGSQLAIPLANDAGLAVTGIDPDRRSIERANQLAGSTSNLKFICGSVADLPAGSLFDVVILSEVLEHLDQPAQMLLAAVEFLQPRGILIVTVPNGYGEFEIDSWIFRRLRLQKLVNRFAQQQQVLAATDNAESGHVQFFTRSYLLRLFREARLSIFREGTASLFAGPIIGHFIARSSRLIEWNAGITDRLPFALASGWYFALRRNHAEQTGGEAL